MFGVTTVTWLITAMFMLDGKYDFDRHHNSYVSIGVPGTVAGLHMAWKDHGRLSWKRLVAPSVTLARQGFAKRMLSSMTPTIVAKDGHVVMVTGSPGSRTIINTVLETILNVVDFGMNAQEAVDAGRFHHQWLPDQVSYEPFAFSPDTLALLKAKGHMLRQSSSQGVAAVIVNNVAGGMLEGGIDRREPDGGAAAK